MTTLREKIRSAILDAGRHSDENDYYVDTAAAADAIMEIPEIKEALEIADTFDDRLADAREDGWNAALE